MFLNMFSQFQVVFEGLRAFFTLIRVFTNMFPCVPDQWTPLAEGAAAILALVWLFARVDPDVNLKGTDR